MKKLLLWLPMLALVLVVGCSQAEGVNQERQKFQQEIESQINRIERRIAEARAQAAELPDEARSRLQQQTDDLEAQKVALENKLSEMKAATDDEWESFKDDVGSASQKLESAFSNLQLAFEEALSEV